MDDSIRTRMQAVELEALYDWGKRDMTELDLFALALLDLIAEQSAINECERIGHDLEDVGGGDRDSGYTCIVCKRCGATLASGYLY